METIRQTWRGKIFLPDWHVSRTAWLEQNGWDPMENRMYYTAMMSGSALTWLLALALVIVALTKPSYGSAMWPRVVMLFILGLLIAACATTFGSRQQKFLEAWKNGSQLLPGTQSAEVIARLDKSGLKLMATTQLVSLAFEVVRREELRRRFIFTCWEAFDSETGRARQAFNTAFDSFRALGWIDGRGYDRYYQKARAMYLANPDGVVVTLTEVSGGRFTAKATVYGATHLGECAPTKQNAIGVLVERLGAEFGVFLRQEL